MHSFKAQDGLVGPVVGGTVRGRLLAARNRQHAQGALRHRLPVIGGAFALVADRRRGLW